MLHWAIPNIGDTVCIVKSLVCVEGDKVILSSQKEALYLCDDPTLCFSLGYPTNLYSRVYPSGLFSDITVTDGQNEYKAHKVILSSVSGKLADMLNESDRVEIKKEVLDFIYGNVIYVKGIETLRLLVDLKRLGIKYEEFILYNLNILLEDVKEFVDLIKVFDIDLQRDYFEENILSKYSPDELDIWIKNIPDVEKLLE